MLYCSQGEDAHLWINGSEHWKFPGPITVETQQEQGLTKYPGWWYYDIVFRRWLCATPHIGFWTTGEHRLRAYVFDRDASAWNPVYLRARQYPGYVGHEWTWPTDENGAATYPELPGKWTGTTSSNKCGNSPMKPELIRINQNWTKVNHNLDPIPGATKYKLLVNGAVIKTSDNPINYSVKCGDRCPPGMKWNDRCGKCVCENMGALKWHLGNAADIARSI